MHAVPGAACLFAAASGTVAIAEGRHWFYLGYLGFAIWAIFLTAAGTALLLTPRRARSAVDLRAAPDAASPRRWIDIRNHAVSKHSEVRPIGHWDGLGVRRDVLNQRAREQAPSEGPRRERTSRE